MDRLDYLLDSDVVIDFLRQVDDAPRYLEKFLHATRLGISAVSLGEVLTGLHYHHATRQDRLLKKLMQTLSVVDFDRAAAEQYAVIRAELRRLGKPLGDADMQIAATAIVNNVTLLTGNMRHYGRIKGLRTVNFRG